MTYVVEKRSVFPHTTKVISAEWMAVKRAKCAVPKAHGRGIAMPSASLARLAMVLLEVEILLHPPLRRHPNITKLFGFTWDYNAPGYTLILHIEFASFGILGNLFNSEQVEELEKRELCLDVAQGLEALHSNMIVHGDVKQDNILMFPHPQRRFVAKLSDFGVLLLGSDQPIAV
jgi:serine/threonine protein kinase